MVQRTHKWCSVRSNSFAEHQTLYLNIKLLSITWNISMLWRIDELANGVTWRPCHSFISYAILQLILKPSLYLLIYLTSLYCWWWRPPRLSRRNHQKYKPQMEQLSTGGMTASNVKTTAKPCITWRSRSKWLFFFIFIEECCVVIEKKIDKKLVNRISYQIWYKRYLNVW